MHEYPITQQIIKIAENACKTEMAERVVSITIVAGELSGFVGESIDMYFNIISEGTLCEGAKLEIERVKPKLKCPACSKIFTRKSMSFECPGCGSDGNLTELGKEFYIKEIEVE